MQLEFLKLRVVPLLTSWRFVVQAGFVGSDKSKQGQQNVTFFVDLEVSSSWRYGEVRLRLGYILRHSLGVISWG